jgi:protein transport protein SEC31
VTFERNLNWETGVERMIKDNFFIGNLEGAIDCALKCGRYGEAFMLAYSSPQSEAQVRRVIE